MGRRDPATLTFLDPPPQAAYSEARKLLTELGALDADGRITDEGRSLRALPLPPRLARMVVDAAREGAGELAAQIAVLVSERGLGGNDVDLTHRLDQFRRDRSRRAEEARGMARRWAEEAGDRKQRKRHKRRRAPGARLSRSHREKSRRRAGRRSCSRMAAARVLDPALSLAREPFIVAAELSGSAAQARILLAAPISPAEIERRFADRIETRDEVSVDPATLALRGRKAHAPRRHCACPNRSRRSRPSPETAAQLAKAIAAAGLDRLPWSKHLTQWRDRVMFLRKSEGDEWPDLSERSTRRKRGRMAGAAFRRQDRAERSRRRRSFERGDGIAAVEHAPRGSTRKRRPISKRRPARMCRSTMRPKPVRRIAIRVQELFGLNTHPAIAGGRVPLVIELLSPAHRPVQVTRDLPGFWRGSYEAVKAEMRGRYPRHPWPDDPANAPPTRRAKRPGPEAEQLKF